MTEITRHPSAAGEVRRAVPADAATLARVGATTFAQAFGALYPPDDLAAFIADNHTPARAAALIADPRQAAWLLEADGEAIGYAVLSPCGLPHPKVTADCLELKRLYLLDGHKGGGGGSRLLKAALAWADRERPRRIWLSVYSDNHAAQRFYRRFGFEHAGDYFFPVGASRDPEFIFRRG